jgi:hypothetical protein
MVIEMKAIVTTHAKKRIKRRLGFNKRIIQSISDEALLHGISHSETRGRLNRYITKIYFRNKAANNIKIYKEKIFIFTDNRLITILSLPNQFKGQVKR